MSQEELLQIRDDFPLGKYSLRIEEGEFSLADYQQMLADNSSEITAHTEQREQAFAEELARWHADGQFHYEAPEIDDAADVVSLQEGEIPVDSSVAGSVWQLLVKEGDVVEMGQPLLLLESMKMEIPVLAEVPGTVVAVKVATGDVVQEGDVLLVLSI